MVVVNERRIADLAVELRLDGELCVITATDANEQWRMITESRAMALEMYHHPYVFKSEKNTIKYGQTEVT